MRGSAKRAGGIGLMGIALSITAIVALSVVNSLVRESTRLSEMEAERV